MAWSRLSPLVRRQVLLPSSKVYCCKSAYLQQRCVIDFAKRTLTHGKADPHTSSGRSMRSWCVSSYGSNDLLELQTVPSPRLRSSTDVIVRVHAASVNPIDLRMRDGYGAAFLNVWRRVEGAEEFPLVLGRDFSGVVVKTGRLVRRFRPGDEVSYA